MLQIKPKEIHPLLAIEFSKVILIAIYKNPPQLSSEHLKAIGLYTIESCFNSLEKTPSIASSKSSVPDAVFYAINFSILTRYQQRQFSDKFAQFYRFSPASFCIEQMNLPNSQEGYRAVFDKALKEKIHSRDMLFLAIDALLPLSNKRQQDTLEKIKAIDKMYSVNDEKTISYIRKLFLKINNSLYTQETKKRKREEEEKSSFESVLGAITPKRMKPSKRFSSALEHCAHTIEKLTKKQFFSTDQLSSLKTRIKLARNETAVLNIHRKMIKNFSVEPLEKNIAETKKILQQEIIYAYGYHRYHLLKIAAHLLNMVSQGEFNLNDQELSRKDGKKPADIQLFNDSIKNFYYKINKINKSLKIDLDDEEITKNLEIIQFLKNKIVEIETEVATYQHILSLIEKTNSNTDKIDAKHLMFLIINFSDTIKSLLFYLNKNILFMDEFSGFRELKNHVYNGSIDRIFNTYRQLSIKEKFVFSDMQELKNIQKDCQKTLLFLEENIRVFNNENMSFINQFLKFLSKTRDVFLNHSNKHEAQAILNIFIDFLDFSDNCIKENLRVFELCTLDFKLLTQIDFNTKHLLENISSLNEYPFFTKSQPSPPVAFRPAQETSYNRIEPS